VLVLEPAAEIPVVLSLHRAKTGQVHDVIEKQSSGLGMVRGLANGVKEPRLFRDPVRYSLTETDADIWSFRRGWADEKQRLQGELLSCRFRFGLLQRVTKADGGEADLWSARDALVLKALTLALAPVLPVTPPCTHVRGNGGAKAAVRQVRAALAINRFVLRTDVKSYYASIDHLLLMDRLALYIRYRGILNLLGQYLRRTAESGGWFWDCERGISLGCPLSPLPDANDLNEAIDEVNETLCGRPGRRQDDDPAADRRRRLRQLATDAIGSFHSWMANRRIILGDKPTSLSKVWWCNRSAGNTKESCSIRAATIHASSTCGGGWRSSRSRATANASFTTSRPTSARAMKPCING
jgi:hypothetical protein